MSINGALANAMSGLTAAARTAEVVASNIANATTEGYRARELVLAQQGAGRGVATGDVLRRIDPVVLSERRDIGTAASEADVIAGFSGRLSDLFGAPGAPGSLGALVAELDSALIVAASQPGADSRLSLAATRAGDVSDRLNGMERALRSLRETADQSIAQQVDRLNSLLRDTEGLNKRLATATGSDAAALLDQRDTLIDEIGTIVPVRLMQRQNGAVALYSIQGAVLLDAAAATIGFDRTPVIMPHMTVQGGLLSSVTVNGRPLDADPPGGVLRGGRLGALLAVRDDMSVTAQQQLDAVALDLALRFQDPALDPTLAATDPGLFTDAGAFVLAGNETGLAGRLRLNAVVDPAAGGAAWRMRDGLGAASPGPSGNGSLLGALSEALSEQRLPASGSLTAANRSLHGLIGDLQTGNALKLQESERRQGFLSVQLETLRNRERAAGVDSDAELQRLLLVEQSYAANARVIETVGQMLDSLLRI